VAARAGTDAFEVRDVGTLKLFFADALEPGDALRHVRAMRARSEEAITRLRDGSEPASRAALARGEYFPLAALELGVALHEAMVDWCRQVESRLGRASAQRPRRT
jgi:Virulence activator alpha C-term